MLICFLIKLKEYVLISVFFPIHSVFPHLICVEQHWKNSGYSFHMLLLHSSTLGMSMMQLQKKLVELVHAELCAVIVRLLPMPDLA